MQYEASGRPKGTGDERRGGWSDSMPAQQPPAQHPPPTRQQALAVIQGEGSTLQKLAEFQSQQYNILAPIDWSGQPPAGTRISLRVEKILVNEDTYQTEGGHALKGHALDRMAASAGLTTISTRRTDGHVHPHFVEFEVVVQLTDGDGIARQGRGTRAIDLREDVGGGVPGADLDEILYSAGSDRNPRKQIIKARQYIVPMCESKARNRAIRHVCSLRGAYSTDELDMPFIAIKLVPDTSDPQAKALVLAQMTGATQALYGGAPQQAIIDAASVSQDQAPPDYPDADQYGAGPEVPPSSGPAPPPVPQSQDPQQRMVGLWDRYKAAGGTAERLRTLVLIESGLTEVDLGHATHEDVDQIIAAADRDMACMASQGGAG